LIGGDDKDKIHGDFGDDLLIGDEIGLDQTSVTAVDSVDAALQSWNDGDIDGAIESLGLLLDDRDDDRLHDRKGSNEFIESSNRRTWNWWVDVDGNGVTTALDALLIINRLNRLAGSPSAEVESLSSDSDAELYDVTLDGRLTPRDVLRVINALNRGGASEESSAVSSRDSSFWYHNVDELMSASDDDDSLLVSP
jgi:hypothetical protein